MIKLVRNTRKVDRSYTTRMHGNAINLQFVIQVQELQEFEGLLLTIKLQPADVNWMPQKLN